jgi:hypothetical protein
MTGTFREWSGGRLCLVLACAFATWGCDSGGKECSCLPSGLSLQICPGLADQVDQVQLSGAACASASKTLLAEEGGSDAGAEGGAVTYDIQPSQAGECTIEVSFKNGLTFSAGGSPSPLQIIPGPGCCGDRLYPDPLSQQQIVACPSADAGVESGTSPRDASGS